MVGLQTKILNVLRSPQFFAAVLLLFFIESAWIAFSAAYPMVFDENTHFTIIQLYSHQLGPFFPAHSTYLDATGAVVRDPSFLYHWLMSFPYRLIAHVTGNQMVQVIDLRFINIFMFGAALVLFRRLLFKTKISPAIIHATLLFFVLTPVVPLLAGQINYDNLLMLVTAAALLMAVNIGGIMSETGRLPAARTLSLLALCLSGSVVQMEFLPLFVAIFAWLGWRFFKVSRSGEFKLSQLAEDWRNSSRIRKLAVALPLVVATWFCLQMYGVNLVRYHTLQPACTQVLTAQQCAGDSNWVREQQALATNTHPTKNPVIYGVSWTYRMFIALFFTSSGGASPAANYLSVNPFPLIFAAALGVFSLGVLLFVRYRRSIFEGYDYLGFLLFASLFYAGVLWLHNYGDYVHYGQKFAIQGRYIFPIALPLMIIIALAFRRLLGSRLHLKAALFSALFILFLQGGGALTYITDSNQNWYWQNRAVVRANQMAQQVVKPLIVIRSPLGNFSRIVGD